jgi:chemotaxis protein histidine kinase CheA
MHIRSFLLKGFIMSAALFFPTDAFAEKGEQAQKPSTQNGHAMEVVEAVKNLDSTSNPSPQAKPEIQMPDRASEKVEKVIPAQASEKVEKATPTQASEKVKKAIPVQANEKVKKAIPARASEKVEKAIPAQASEKVEKAVQVPNQASEKAQHTVQEVKQRSEKASKAMQSTIKETKKAVDNSLPEKNQEAETETTKQQKTTPNNNEIHSNEAEESSDKSVQHAISGENTNQQSTKMVQMLDDDKTVQSIKEAGSIDEEPETEEKEKFPSGQEKYPQDIMVVHSPHNTKTPDGSSKDRTGYGQNTTSFVDKWLLEAEKYLNLKRIQPLVSRAYEYRNQWVNAPPSQPPQTTPFF